VLVDRGHRELPLRATYVGRILPVAAGAWVEVIWDPSDAGVWLVEPQSASLHGGGPLA
jgi:pyrimidine operon attenuation protein/uracil phosphoribosyltransferase